MYNLLLYSTFLNLLTQLNDWCGLTHRPYTHIHTCTRTFIISLSPFNFPWRAAIKAELYFCNLLILSLAFEEITLKVFKLILSLFSSCVKFSLAARLIDSTTCGVSLSLCESYLQYWSSIIPAILPPLPPPQPASSRYTTKIDITYLVRNRVRQDSDATKPG